MSDYPVIGGPLGCAGEMADWGRDPESGACVRRLTSAPMWSHNIYGEQPYGSPDGARLLIARTTDLLQPGRQFLVADLSCWSLTLVETGVPAEAVAHVPWGEWVYYPMGDGALRRVSLLTLERQQVLPPGTVPPGASLESITPDERTIIGWERAAVGLRTFALALPSGTLRTLCEGPDNRNPHAQVDPGPSGQWLFQLLRDGGVPVFVQPLAGGEAVPLPIGASWSAESSGHMAWVGHTGTVAVAVNWRRQEQRHDPRHPEGNLLIAAPGDARPTVFPAPQYGFYHVSISRCGTYFVCDDFMDFRTDNFVTRGAGPVRLVVGNLRTGRCRPLLSDCQAYGIAGSSRYEPDPYFTADTRYVIYNASPFGLTQVFAAEIPAGFLDSLG